MKTILLYGLRLVLALGGIYWLVWALVGQEPLVTTAEAGAQTAAAWLTNERIKSNVADAPNAEWALVLGTSAKGQLLNNRCQTAAALFHAGKVKHLLLSGDGHHPSYNEPAMMRKLLIGMGVPASALKEDPAGLSTYDSLTRLRQTELTNQPCLIVTQSLHAARTALLATGLGIDGYVVLADPLSQGPTASQQKREARATIRAWLDLAGARQWTQLCKSTREIRLVGVLLVKL
jgi:SanA protein